MAIITFIRSLYITNRFFLILGAIVVLFVVGHFVYIFHAVGIAALLLIFTLVFIDVAHLYGIAQGINAHRITPQKLSLGDENLINLKVENNYRFKVLLEIIDEIPFQFQLRDFLITTVIEKGQTKELHYTLKPLQRGEFQFGKTLVFVKTRLSLIKRCYRQGNGVMVPVYPSFIQMRKYELMAISNHLQDEGIKRVRSRGKHAEFDQIREYVKGDDYRTINWKATARKASIMVNQYQDEKSQRVYSLIDMGRVMQMPFEGMSLLDYAINASLVISNVAIRKLDKAGLVTFSNKVETVLPASRKNNYIIRILDILYNQQTRFLESNFELLYLTVRHKIRQRSLLILYTNFESLVSLRRQISILQKLSQSHLLLVVFFENTELKAYIGLRPNNLEQVYIKTIAEKFAYEKRMIVRELQQYGIYSILTKPQNLTVNLINKYLEFKSAGMI